MSTAHIAILTIFFINSEAAKILAVSPTPSLHHQEVFYPMVKELARRGHEVTFITTNTAYPDGNLPSNIREIDLQDLSYGILMKLYNLSDNGIDNLIQKGLYKTVLEVMLRVFEEQMRSDPVQNLIKHHKTFDLLLMPAWFRPTMIWSHIYKAPVIKLRNLGMDFDGTGNFAASIHPIFYPDRNNFTIFGTFMEMYKRFYAQKEFNDYEVEENEVVRRVFGVGVPLLSELEQNAHVLMLNGNSFCEGNRPLPRNVVYFRYVPQKFGKTLPENINSFLNAAQGSIFVRFDTRIHSSSFPPATLQILLKVFSELPYNVLWQLDVDGLEGTPENVVVGKWFPEIDIFRHPNLKLVISQGDIKTTEEAIDAGVPFIGLRNLGEQWLSVEHYVQYGIGLQLDMNSMDEEVFKSSVLKVIRDSSYRDNIHRLRELIHDTPTPALDHAILWTEYVLKFSGAAHLRSPASNMTWREYFELELFAIIISSIVIMLSCFLLVFKLIIKKIEGIIANQAMHDDN